MHVKESTKHQDKETNVTAGCYRATLKTKLSFFYSHTRLHGRRKNYLIVTSLQFPKVTRTWNFSYSITWHLYDFFFQILQSIEKNQQLQKPLSCPDWIHFVIQECCSYEAKERPPAIALFDCLTCRLAMIFSKKVCFRNHESFVSGIYR